MHIFYLNTQYITKQLHQYQHYLRLQKKCFFLLLTFIALHTNISWSENTPSSPRYISIHTQDMSKTLNELSMIYETAFAVKTDHIEHLQARTLEGKLSLIDALNLLFEGSNLDVSQFENGFII